ncbi:MAG: PfkB family carbohydrate kinase [Gammaproteobacteria bacterium]|nr:PfkB family carbohydrate kinase [Gammaproteobacteria bacterium]
MTELLEVVLRNKIIIFSDLQARINKNVRIVQSHGVFDLLHIGHIKHFQTAKKQGDILIVTITPDRFVNKGPNRPRFTEKLRAEAIAALDCVDYVIINHWPTAVEAIKLIKPTVYAKGDEYKISENDLTGKIDDEAAAVREIGGKTFFTNEVTFSSSSLLNEFFSPFSDDVISYLNNFKKKYSFHVISSYLEKSKNLKVLLIGETIVDAYRFTEAIGKSGKEPTLVAKYRHRELYAGGILAMANHLSDFCSEITCLTYLGENAEHESMIQNSIAKNVYLEVIYKKNSPTIVKTRFVEEYLRQKLFEEYEINDDFLESEQQSQLIQKMDVLLKSHDLVIVADYGHGLLDDKTINYLTRNAKYLAVNTQANAGNNGFNFISKYKKANYVVVASRELQLNYRQKHLTIPEQLNRLVLEHDYDKTMITSGKDGAFVCKQRERPCMVPAFATAVIDRVGAGDAVLAISSLYAYHDAPSDMIGFIGNVAGAEAVSIMGNKSAINKIGFMKHISHLLK